MESRNIRAKMKCFTIQLAGREVAVSAMHESSREFCGQYLCEGEPRFSVTVSLEDIAFEREKIRREDVLEGRTPQQHTDAYLEIIAIQRKIAEKLFDYDTLLFHGSTIAVDNQAYLFTAKSGTGKSTHTRLWREMLGEKAVMVNDDKPFLKITEEGVLACGSPWNGKHKLGSNIQVPLKAICILERGEENRIQKIEPREALLMLIQQSSRPMDPRKMPKYMELLDRLAASVQFYKLTCNVSIEAAQLSYRTMGGELPE